MRCAADADAEELSARVVIPTAPVPSAMVTILLETVALVAKAELVVKAVKGEKVVLEAPVVRVVLGVPALVTMAVQARAVQDLAAQDQVQALVQEDLALVPAALDLVQGLATALLLVEMADTTLLLSPQLVQLLSV